MQASLLVELLRYWPDIRDGRVAKRSFARSTRHLVICEDESR